MRLSLVVPTYTINQNLLEITLRCLSSFRNYVDELIVCEDANVYIPEIHKLADIYITHKNMQMAGNSNMGWRAATGDYIGSAGADTILVEGDLRWLCVPDKFSMPQVLRRNVTETSCCFVMHRDMYNKYGLWEPGSLWQGTDTFLFNKYRPFMQMDHRVIIDTENGSPGSFQRAYGTNAPEFYPSHYRPTV